MSSPTYKVLIDWNGDGDFTDAGEDVTARVLMRGGKVIVNIGRDQGRAGSPMRPGEASFDLDDNSGDYSPENSSSPLADLVGPGREVMIQATSDGVTYTIYRGYLNGYDLDPDFEERSVHLSCHDALGLLTEDGSVSTAVHFSITTGDAINLLLDAIGWPEDKRDIDRGATVIRWWWAQGNAADELQKIVDSEGIPALCFVGSDGSMVFRDRHHRLQRAESVTSQATFSDAYEIRYSTPLTYEAGWREIVNSVSLSVETRDPDESGSKLEKVDGSGEFVTSTSEVWAADTSYTLSAGEIEEIYAEGSEPFVDAVTPAEGKDYLLAAGSVNVELTRSSGKVTTIRLTAVGGTAVVRNLRLRAHPLKVTSTSQVKVSDAASIKKHKIRTGEVSAPWASKGDARAIAMVLLAYRGVRLPIVNFRLIGENDARIAQQFGRDMSDRVHIVEPHLGIDDDYFLEKISHELDYRPVTHFGFEKAPSQVDDVFILGSATNGVLGTNKLGKLGLTDPALMFVIGTSELGEAVLAY